MARGAVDDRRFVSLSCALALFALPFAPVNGAALEDRAKASCLYNFARFAVWPAEAPTIEAQGRLRFSVNREAARRAGSTRSSRLLRLALEPQ